LDPVRVLLRDISEPEPRKRKKQKKQRNKRNQETKQSHKAKKTLFSFDWSQKEANSEIVCSLLKLL